MATKDKEMLLSGLWGQVSCEQPSSLAEGTPVAAWGEKQLESKPQPAWQWPLHINR